MINVICRKGYLRNISVAEADMIAMVALNIAANPINGWDLTESDKEQMIIQNKINILIIQGIYGSSSLKFNKVECDYQRKTYFTISFHLFS